MTSSEILEEAKLQNRLTIWKLANGKYAVVIDGHRYTNSADTAREALDRAALMLALDGAGL